ncbi:hypothetical protein D1867_05730 [Acidianus infernus]|uniref:Uncharacterized protein n=1 Tax=Acidianus infernus TaxID=12915 RepID=A0A6A9QC19_ACIIN|nr:hypothetical protein [Acidianus infernus]MCY0873818.1 hypothetical protein [Acidianus infernus]MUM64751.1 hypothetical protein [Acidianus infernus]
MGNTNKLYSEILSSYVIIILIVLIMMGIMGVLAIPYYISPITYSNGGAPAGVTYLDAGIILIALVLVGIYLIERKQFEFGLVSVLFVLIVLTILIWDLYGVNDVTNIMHNI